MLEFLIPAILAAETRNKINKNKEKSQVAESLRKEIAKNEEFNKKYKEKYTDVALEKSVKQISDGELMKIFKSLPSYDPKESWTIITGSNYILNKFRIRFTLSKYGKIPISESSSTSFFDAISNKGSYYGESVFDYPGQMQHELFLEWEKQLNENGFPYHLMVDNCFEYDGKAGFFVPVFSRGIIAKDYKYRYNNHYYWSSYFENDL